MKAWPEIHHFLGTAKNFDHLVIKILITYSLKLMIGQRPKTKMLGLLQRKLFLREYTGKREEWFQ